MRLLIESLHRAVDKTLSTLFLLLIRLYQLTLSQFIGQQCRFAPTCSNYTAEAIGVHGAIKGAYLGVKRISKCHPWHEGGVDLVPPVDQER
jgi:putative membrane protein insertion efficiency factor